MDKHFNSTPPLNEEQYIKFLENISSDNKIKTSQIKKQKKIGQILYKKIKYKPMFK